MFRIGSFAKLVQVSPRMLRHYEKCGLLVPSFIDKTTGIRFYSASQMPLVKRITAFRDMGFLIEEIDELLEHFDNKEYIERAIAEKGTAIRATIQAEQEKLQNSCEMLSMLKDDTYQGNIQAQIKPIPPMNILSLRKVVPDYSHQQSLWSELFDFISQNELYPNLSGQILCIYHSKEYQETSVEIEVAVTVHELAADIGAFCYKVTEAIETAVSVTFEGFYDQLALWEGKTAIWLEQNGYEIAGTEMVLGTRHPLNENNPENYVSALIFPIRKE